MMYVSALDASPVGVTTLSFPHADLLRLCRFSHRRVPPNLVKPPLGVDVVLMKPAGSRRWEAVG